MTMPIQAAITGRGSGYAPDSPEGALHEFYRGFNLRDLSLVQKTWLDAPAASMDNPLGGICRGWNEIRAVYERIFGGPARVEVEFFDYTIEQCADAAFVAVGRERGTLVLPTLSLDLRIRTSRIFTRVDGHWRQLHHHGSIEDADLLARYQAAVRQAI